MAADRVIEARQSLTISVKRFLRQFEGYTSQYLERSALWRYGLALIICSFVILLRVAFSEVTDASPFTLFLGMVFLSAWYAGFGPGVISMLSGLGAHLYYYALPEAGYKISNIPASENLAIAGFVALSLLINILLAARRSARLETIAQYRRATNMLETVVRHNEYLNALHATAVALGNRQNSIDLLHTILDKASRLVNTDNGYVYLYDSAKDKMVVKIATGIFKEYVGYELDKGTGLAGKVWQYGRAMTVEDYDTWEGRSKDFKPGFFKAGVAVPLHSQGKVTGVIALAYTELGRKFARDEINVLTRFAELASIILENSRLQQEAAEELAHRKRNEAELEAQKQLYETLLKAQSDVGEAFFIIENNKIVYANQACMNISGYTLDELYAVDSFLDIVAPEEQELLAEKMIQRLSGHSVEDHYETVIRHKHGQKIDIEVGVKELRNQDKLQLVVIARDITSRKRQQNAQDLLARASRLVPASIDYQETMQNIARLVVPIFSDWCAVDVVEDGKLVRLAVEHSDPAKVELAHELYRRNPPDPSAPTGAWHVIKTRRSEYYPQITDEMIEANTHDEHTLRILKELGLRSAITVPIVINGEGIGAISFITAESGRLYDKADLKTAETLGLRASTAIYNAKLYQETRELAAQLQSSKDQLEVILQGVADGISVQTPAGKVIFANQAVAQILGYPSVGTFISSSLVKTVADLRITLEDGSPITPEDLPGRRAVVSKTEATGTFIVHKFDSGEVRVISSHAKPVFNSSGEVIYSVNIMRDITNTYFKEEQKDEFIAVASHELKTPVTSLKTFAQALIRKADQRGADEEEVEYLKSIERQTDRLTRLIKNILDVSRLESGELAMETRNINIGNLVRNIIERLRVTIDTHNIKVGSVRNIMLRIDPDRMEQVLNNLIMNASQHSQTGTTIQVDVERRGTELHILVKDEGGGVSIEQQTKIFERFYQAGGPRSIGAGLGLYISQKIVHQHGGRLWVTSEPGRGSIFGVALPLPAGDESLPQPDSVGEQHQEVR